MCREFADSRSRQARSQGKMMTCLPACADRQALQADASKSR